MPQAKSFDAQDVVDRYFQHIHELRNGDESAVDRLIELWAEDGVFEFAGAPPVTGTYKGRNAIHVLYKNRVKASGMPLKLEARATTARAAPGRDVALGLVETRVIRSRTLAAAPRSSTQKVAVGWTTVVGTNDQQGFQVSGNHTFDFDKGGRIKSLKVVVASKPQKTDGLSLEGLAVKDIGRLSLAAWAVV